MIGQKRFTFKVQLEDSEVFLFVYIAGDQVWRESANDGSKIFYAPVMPGIVNFIPNKIKKVLRLGLVFYYIYYILEHWCFGFSSLGSTLVFYIAACARVKDSAHAEVS